MKWALIAVRYELAIWRSLFRWTFRRPVTSSPEDLPFGYTQAVAPVMWAFIAISAIEIPVFHLLVPWRTVQYIGLGLGTWGLFWMIGLLAAQKIHPHVVESGGIRIRNAFSHNVFVPWSNIETIRQKNRNFEKSRTIQVNDGVLSLVIFSQTNVDIVLREPIQLRYSEEPISELRIYADDASGFTKAALRKQPTPTH
ncbi:hypothetical protein [Catelliglobosispora koreensis]|uniref:hypothetical protein n=1 Tax=Catelliglobosispora koreensis TaxID=129052 RepID=UPI000361B69A|nr:hypothetical protein [Catelliglobosispora koreensis]